MIRFIFLSILLSLLLSCSILNKKKEEVFRVPQSESNRLVGYYTDWSPVASDYMNKRLLTHIIYAFVIPEWIGGQELYRLKLPTRLLRRNSHVLASLDLKNSPKFLMAVGGYSNGGELIAPVFEKIVDSPKGNEKLVNNLVSLCHVYGLDGIDVDWEFPTNSYTEKFADFIVKLRTSMNKTPRCHTLSVAVPTRIEDVTAFGTSWYPYVDFVNLMAYDNNTEQHHSSYEHAEFAIDLWTEEMGLPHEKAVLGVPLYSKPKILKYSSIVASNFENSARDQAVINNQSTFYNGEPTMIRKTILGQQYGGIMVWELGQDSTKKPMLKVIEDYLLRTPGE